ncbi:MAG: hypothetical protein KJ709_00055 [Nanoarchaeota archaeon]|nr:hypothetical protein [Nanoarchaeota archaeon]
MDLEERFNQRYDAIVQNLEETPGLQGQFLLMYTCPSGKTVDVVGPVRYLLLVDMDVKLADTKKYGEQIHYMVRKIGDPHYADTEKPVEHTILSPEETMKKVMEFSKKTQGRA